MLYAFYETYEDNLMEVGRSTPSIPNNPHPKPKPKPKPNPNQVGRSTPSIPAGQDTTLAEDPPNWTGDDMP